MDDSYDIIVIGGGPAGLSAAINGVVRGRRVLVLDTGASMLTRAEKVDNYLGMPGISGWEMMDRFREHALALGVTMEKGKVTGVLPMGGTFMVSRGSDVLSARAVILATGVLREDTIDGEEAFLGKGVSYCAACDGMLYREKKVIVYGLAADAPEEANDLAQIGVQVLYLCPGERPVVLNQAIEWRRGTLGAIGGDTVVRHAVVVTQAGSVSEGTEGVFILRDTVAPQSIISGLRMERGYIAADSEHKTSIPGIFACGDCTGLPLQVAKAVGEGLVAGQEAARYTGSAPIDEV